MLVGHITHNRATPVPRSKQRREPTPPVHTYQMPPEELEKYRAMPTPKPEQRFAGDEKYRG